MRSSLRYFLIAVALLAGVLFVACGSDSDDNGDADAGDPAAEQPVDGDDATEEPKPEQPIEDDDGDASGNLSSFTDRFGTTEVKVTYTFSGLGVGDDQLGAQMTFYSKPPDRWRTDVAIAEGESSTIFDGDDTYVCTSSGDGGTCFISPLGDIGTIPFLNVFTDPDEFDDLIDTSLGVDVDQSSREIAGQDATCFSFSSDLDGASGSAEYCFRDDGVLLLLNVEDPESDVVFGYEATDVSDSVSDSDFDPPYDVRTIPGQDGIPDAP